MSRTRDGWLPLHEVSSQPNSAAAPQTSAASLNLAATGHRSASACPSVSEGRGAGRPGRSQAAAESCALDSSPGSIELPVGSHRSAYDTPDSKSNGQVELGDPSPTCNVGTYDHRRRPSHSMESTGRCGIVEGPVVVIRQLSPVLPAGDTDACTILTILSRQKVMKRT